MNKITKQFEKATKHITLTQDEKDLMRERLVSYMEYKPIRTKVEPGKAEQLFSYFRIRHYSGALMIAALVLSSSFGVSFAAGDALPGDLLYNVKVNINEEIKTVFIQDESRLAWDQERAERRLVEASQLAAEGRLDDEAQKKVSRLFAEHTEKVVEQVLAYEETDPVLAAEASSMFEDSLETHEAVLARLIVENDEEQDEGAKGLVEQVRTASMEVEKIREDAEEKIDIIEESEEGDSEVDEDGGVNLAESANMRVRAAYRAKERAETLLFEAESLYMELDAQSELRTQAEAQTAFGKIHMDKGEVALVEYDLSGAYGSYKKAAASFQKVAQLLKVATLFSIEIYTEEQPIEADLPEQEAEVAVGESTDLEAEVSKAAAEEPSIDETILKLQSLRTQVEELIVEARTILLTHEGFDAVDVEEAQNRIKDTEALILRGEIGMVLEDYEDAEKLFIQAFELAELTVLTLEREIVNDNVKGVSTLDEAEEAQTLTFTHTFSEGVHSYTGELETQDPCETLEGIAFVTEGFPEEITLEITANAPENEEGCIEVATTKMFSIETAAQPDAVLVSVNVNGEEIEWNLVEGIVEEVSPEPEIVESPEVETPEESTE